MRIYIAIDPAVVVFCFRVATMGALTIGALVLAT